MQIVCMAGALAMAGVARAIAGVELWVGEGDLRALGAREFTGSSLAACALRCAACLREDDRRPMASGGQSKFECAKTELEMA
jgi:hypothetical protein